MTSGHTTGEQILHCATITRVDVMQTGARVLTCGALATSALLLVLITSTHPADAWPIFGAALHFLNIGATLAVGVGALHCHRALLAAQRRTQAQMTRYDHQIEDRLKKLDKQIARLQQVENQILSAAADDLDARRHIGRRN